MHMSTVHLHLHGRKQSTLSRSPFLSLCPTLCHALEEGAGLVALSARFCLATVRKTSSAATMIAVTAMSGAPGNPAGDRDLIVLHGEMTEDGSCVCVCVCARARARVYDAPLARPHKLTRLNIGEATTTCSADEVSLIG